MVFLSVVAFVVGVSLALALYRVVRGPGVYDRMLGIGVSGTNTIILICLVGFIYDRIEMFVDIAIAYAMLNFIASLVVAKYLSRASTEKR